MWWSSSSSVVGLSWKPDWRQIHREQKRQSATRRRESPSWRCSERVGTRTAWRPIRMSAWTHLADLHELLSPLLASFGGHAQGDELLSLKPKKKHTHHQPSSLPVQNWVYTGESTAYLAPMWPRNIVCGMVEIVREMTHPLGGVIGHQGLSWGQWGLGLMTQVSRERNTFSARDMAATTPAVPA